MTTPQPDALPPHRDNAPARKAHDRPGIVTTAAGLAMIWGGLTTISALVSMIGGSLLSSGGRACVPNDQSGLCAFVGDSSGLLIVIGSALIAAAILVIWGGVVARNGKTATTLVAASGIQIVIQLVWMIETGSIAFGIVGVIVPIGILALILSPASKRWFQHRSEATL